MKFLFNRLFLPFLCAGIITACAGNSGGLKNIDPALEQEALDFLSEQQMQASSVAYRLVLSMPPESGPKQWLSAFLQPSVTRSLPFIYEDASEEEKKRRSIPEGQTVALTGVLKEFLPHGTDLRPGDMITAFNGISVTSAGQLDRLIRNAERGSWITLAAARGGKESEYRLPLFELERDIPAAVDPGLLDVYSGVSLYGEIVLSKPLLRFVESEDELAFLIAHEIAHLRALQYTVQTMTREERKVAKIGTRGGSFLAGLVSGTFEPAQAKAHMNSRTFLEAEEIAADDYALELVHRAGYDPKAAEEVLERIAVEITGSHIDSIAKSHPVTADRAIMASKKAAELVLDPNPAPFKYAAMTGPDQGLGVLPGTRLDHEGLGIITFGLSSRCSFLARRAGSGEGRLIFGPGTDEICWFVELGGLASAKQAFQRSQFHIEWFSPSGVKVHEADFQSGPGSGSRMTSSFHPAKFPLEGRSGKWRVRVTLGGRLIDERVFLLEQGKVRKAADN